MLSRRKAIYRVLISCALIISISDVSAESISELNTAIQNPVADLSVVPFQSNFDFHAGPYSCMQTIINFQPVIPIKLTDEWNLITRTVMPITHQPPLLPGMHTASGLGDTEFTTFLSPRRPGSFIWGVGPAFLLPTGTNPMLGNEQWGAGPSIVGLIQPGHWTIGFIGNQVWSFAGNNSQGSVSEALTEPFISYTFEHGWSVSVLSETTADWMADAGNQWTVPIDLVAAKISMFGKQAVSIGGGFRYFPIRPEDQATWGIRFTVSFLFP